MTNEQFLQQFGHFIDAPNGIQKLREIILQLAVQGRLLSQDPREEPAQDQLDRIQVAKEQKIAEGKFKKPKELPPIADEDGLHPLPCGWSYARLGELLRVINGRAYKRHEMLESGTPLLRVGNLFTSNEWYYSDLELEADKYCNEGDLIFAWSASFGPFIWSGPKVIYHYHIWKLDLYDKRLCFKSYLYTYLLEKTQEIKSSGHGISMAHMTKEKMEKLVVPVPPLAEQHRIVARVDELMALCDQLEAERNAREATRQRLIRAVHHPLTATNCDSAHNSIDSLPAWHRIRDNFADLYTTLESVQALRQTILQLAVQGKLVEQDEDDEDVVALLSGIKAEQDEHIRIGNTKSYKYPKESPTKLGLTPIPEHWRWTYLGELLIFGPRNGFSPKSVDYPTGVKSLTLTAITRGSFDPEQFKYLDIDVEEDSHLWLRHGDILMQRANSLEYVGVSAIFDGTDGEYIYPDLIMKMRPSSELNAKYVHLVLSSSYAREYMRDRTTGTSGSMPKINQQTVNSIPVALPPLAEQHRIVAKVDQLMTLCDQLEASIRNRNDTATRYAEAVVNRISAA